MLINRKPDLSGIHARTCWLGAQLDLASLLGDIKDEEKSLDVFRTVEASLNNDHLAAGEWNRSINAQGEAVIAEEAGKDTPRFPPYPRYKSSWEYLIRIIGLKIDWDHFYIDPFKTMDFSLKGIMLAGTRFDIEVEKDWTQVFIDSARTEFPVKIDRNEKRCNICIKRGK